MPADRPILAETPDGTIRVVVATRDELPALLGVQHEAFARVARQAGVPLENMPPANEPLGRLQELFDGGTQFFVALDSEGRVLGTVRAERVGEVVEVGRLAVAEGALRRGVATALMRALEAAHPDAGTFDLFTGAEAVGPIALYEGLGYQTYATEQMGPWTLVRMAKPGPMPLG